MDENPSEDILLKNMFELASELLAIQTLYQQDVCAQSHDHHQKLTEAHLLTTGVIASIQLRINGKPAKKLIGLEQPLISSFTIGMNLCTQTILNGLYLQASTLLRQQLETLAALYQIKDGKRRNGKPPNIEYLTTDLRKLYVDLTGAAHVSQDHIIAQTTTLASQSNNEALISRSFVEIDIPLSRKLHALHTMAIIELIRFLEDYLNEYYDLSLTDYEIMATNLAIKYLKQEGMAE